MEKIAQLREHMPMPNPSFPIKIGQVRSTAPNAILFPHHWHEHMEFLFFVSGKAAIECGNKPFVFEGGELAVINSNELHYGVSHTSDLVYYVMIVDIELLHSHSADAVETKFITPIRANRILFQNQIRQDTDVQACMRELINELEHQSLGYELSIKSHLYRLLSILIRKYVAAATDREAFNSRQRDLERMAPIFHYINEHYQHKLTVEILADQAGLSRFHFSRLFKQLTDKSLMEYINMIRIHKSERLLQHTSMTISEVAMTTGFNDIYYFSRTFKKMKQVSPTVWRDMQV